MRPDKHKTMTILTRFLSSLCLLLLFCGQSDATVQARRYPTDTPVFVCTPNDTDQKCLAGSGGKTILTPNVGIGSSSPIQALDVVGTVRATSFQGDGSQLTGISSPWTRNAPYIYPNIITDNVGIGTSIPGNALDVITGLGSRIQIGRAGGLDAGLVLGYYGFSGYAFIKNTGFTDANYMIAQGADSILHLNSSANYISLENAGNTKVAIIGGNVGIGGGNIAPGGKLIVQGGNVGINNNAPGKELDVTGTVRTTGFILSNNGAASGFILQSSGSTGIGTWVPAPTGGGGGTPGGSSPQLQFNNAGTFDGISGSSADSNGNIGIGTSTAVSKLNIVGNVGIGTISYSPYVNTTAPAGGMIIEGNVGIGTTAPVSLLNLNGMSGASLLAGATGTVIGDMSNGGGISAAFNGTTSQAYGNSAQSTAANGGPAYVGKNWGTGNSYIITKFIAYGALVQGFSSAGSAGTVTLTLYGKNTAPSGPTDGTSLGTLSFTDTRDATAHTLASGITVSTAYQYHWLAIANTKTSDFVAVGQVQLFASIATTTFTVSGNGGAIYQLQTSTAANNTTISDNNISAEILNNNGTVTFPFGLTTNVGIGSLSAGQALDVQGTVRIYGNEFVNGNVGIGSLSPQSSLVIGSNGMIGSSGTAPTVGNNDCGSTSQGTVTAGSTDMRGDVVVGTLAVTSCKVTLNKSHSTLRCIPTDDTSLLTIRASETANTITFVSASSVSGDTITWHCDE